MRNTIHRKTLAVLSVAAVLILAGCHELNGSTDMSGLGSDGVGGSYAYLYDVDGQHNEACTYNVDPGCFQQDGSGNGFRVAYDAVGPGGVNDRRARELAWNDFSHPDVCGTTDPVTGQPEYGWPGYGGFTPPTEHCVDRIIEEIQDDPGDANDDSSYICTTGNSCHDAYGSTTAGADPKDTARTTWYRHFFVNTTQGRDNVRQYVWALRDFYLVIITDPAISGNQATGHPSCIRMADNPNLGLPKVHLGRLCG